jgi:hypothetical protein
MDFIQKRRKILPNLDRRFKDESPIFFNKHKFVPKGLESFDFFNFRNRQNRDFLTIQGHFFFQTENTKCTIFEQNRLIACQT